MRAIERGREAFVVAKSALEQALRGTETFRDQGHPGQKNMQRSRRGTSQVAANKRVELTSESAGAASSAAHAQR